MHETEAKPTGWRAAWEKWKQLARRAAAGQGWMLLTLVYYVFLLPFWIGFWFFGRGQGRSYWIVSRKSAGGKDRYLRQF